MSGRVRDWLEGLGGWFLVVFPPVGAGLIVVSTLIGLAGSRHGRPAGTSSQPVPATGPKGRTARPRVGPAKRLGPWLLVWAGAFVMWLGPALRGEFDPNPLLQLSFGILMGVLAAVSRKRLVLAGVVTGFLCVALLGFAERELSRALWNDSATPQTYANLLAGITELSGDSPGLRRNDVLLIRKDWILAPGTEQLELSFEVRGRSGRFGWQWYTTHSDTRQFPVSDGGGFTRIMGLQQPVVRRVRTPDALAGRTVRASLEMRAATPTELQDCRLQLRTFEPSLVACRESRLAADWQTYDLMMTFPDNADHRAVELAVGPVDVAYMDIRDVRFEVEQDGDWISVEPAEPAGIHLRAALPGTHVFSQPSVNLIPTAEWRRHTLTVAGNDLRELSGISFLLQLERGAEIELRNVSLRNTGGGQQPTARPVRRSALWFDQANLAGHAFTSVGLMAIALGSSVFAGLVPWLLALGSIFLTGGRAATFAALAGGLFLIMLRLERPRDRVVAVTVTIACLSPFVFLGANALGRLAFWADTQPNTVSRAMIWETAIRSIGTDPLGRGDGFIAAWNEQHSSDNRPPPTHAHNFWLSAGVHHGVPGILGAAWLTVGLIWLGWHLGRWQGLGLVSSLLVMQLFDDTLFTTGVLVPLVIGLNALRESRRAPIGP